MAHQNRVTVSYRDIRGKTVTFKEGEVYFDGVKQMIMGEGDLVVEWRPREQPSPPKGIQSRSDCRLFPGQSGGIMSDILDRLKEPIIGDAFADGRIISGTLAERLINDRGDAAKEIERLRLFERYANRATEELVETAIDEKTRTGKYPFED